MQKPTKNIQTFSKGCFNIFISRSLDSDCEAVPNRPSGNDNEEDDNVANSSNVSASDMRFNEAQPGSSSSYSSNTSQRGNVSGKLFFIFYIEIVKERSRILNRPLLSTIMKSEQTYLSIVSNVFPH